MKITIVLPSLNPDEKLMIVVTALVDAGFDRILVVNDGSTPDCLPLFEQAAACPGVTLLTHESNCGKGRALKTAFAYILAHQPDCAGVVTVDGDNQHRVDDIRHLADSLLANDSAMILGVRDFDLPDVPRKSRLGNKLTAAVFLFVCGIRISDTQTGLRAIPTRFLPVLLTLEGERFEYETNMLLATRTYHIPVRELPIQTVYLDGNATSHYRPLIDSFKILRLMLKFLASSGLCSVLDIGAYGLLFALMDALPLRMQVFWATVVSRIVSSVANYAMNRMAVFRNGDAVRTSLKRYYLLATIQMLASFLGVYALTAFIGGGSVLIKMIVDVALFFISFRLQRDWVFDSSAPSDGC